MPATAWGFESLRPHPILRAAFVDALQPVFLVGAGITSVAFILAWILKEKPLRKTTHANAEESVAVVGAEPIPAG